MKIKVKKSSFAKAIIVSKNSPRSLSLQLGKSPTYIGSIMNGVFSPSNESAMEICDALNVEFDDIFFIVFNNKSHQKENENKISV